MSDALEVINRVIQEHQRLQGNIKLVGESVNDMEAMLSLQQVYSGWTGSSQEIMDEKQKQLQRTVSLLYAGLNNHFAFEEQALPPLFGELLMQALILEHQKIRRELDDTKSLIDATRLAELSQEKLWSQKAHIQQVINTLSQTVEEHAAREETILSMMKKALEKE